MSTAVDAAGAFGTTGPAAPTLWRPHKRQDGGVSTTMPARGKYWTPRPRSGQPVHGGEASGARRALGVRAPPHRGCGGHTSARAGVRAPHNTGAAAVTPVRRGSAGAARQRRCGAAAPVRPGSAGAARAIPAASGHGARHARFSESRPPHQRCRGDTSAMAGVRARRRRCGRPKRPPNPHHGTRPGDSAGRSEATPALSRRHKRHGGGVGTRTPVRRRKCRTPGARWLP
jgi:hypothetical protein